MANLSEAVLAWIQLFKHLQDIRKNPEKCKQEYKQAEITLNQKKEKFEKAKNNAFNEFKANISANQQQQQNNQFKIAELPLKEFKFLGIDINEINKENLDKLLQGKPTDTITFQFKNAGAAKQLEAKLFLQRNPDKSASLFIKDPKLKTEQKIEAKNNKLHTFKR